MSRSRPQYLRSTHGTSGTTAPIFATSNDLHFRLGLSYGSPRKEYMAAQKNLKRKCPWRPRENAKMWHMVQKMTTLIFRSEIPNDEFMNLVCLFCSDLLLFSRKFAKTVQDADHFKYGGLILVRRVSTQELRSWKVQKQVRSSSFCVFVWMVLANHLTRKPDFFL